MTIALLRVPTVVRGPAALGGRVGRRMLAIPADVVREAATLPRAAARVLAPDGAGERQVWAAGDSAMLEVRGLDEAPTSEHRAARAAAVERAVRSAPGIRWARIDPATSRLAVRYDRSRHSVAGLVDTLAAAEGLVAAAVEEMSGASGNEVAGALGELVQEPVPELDLPEGEPTAGDHATAAAAQLAALAAAVTGRLAGLPALPASVAALGALAEHQPWLRSGLEARLGPATTERALTLVTAVTLGLSQNVLALLLAAGESGQSLRADQARTAAHAARADELYDPDRPEPPAVTAADGRPAPLPAGPVEQLARRMARVSLVASGAVLVGTRNADLAGRVVLVGVPRPAHAVKRGFVDALAIGLGRRGVVVRDPAALRRLDVLTTVIVESAVLHSDRPVVVDAHPLAEGWNAARVWRAAQRLLDAEHGSSPAPSRRRALLPAASDGAEKIGPAGARTVLLTHDGVPVGEVLVGRELDPYADAVLSATRGAGLRLLVTEDPTAPELGSRADAVLRDGHGAADWLRREVRTRQADGEVVAVLGTDGEALDAADVAIGVIPATGSVPWPGDLLCGPGLQEVPRLIAAAPAARGTAQRGVRITLGAAFLGGLMLAVSPVGQGRRAQLPVTLAGIGAFVAGIRAARAVLRRPDPAPVLHTPWHALEPEEVLGRLPWPGPVQREAGDGAAPHPSAPRSALRTVAALASNIRAELDDPLTPVLATGAAASAVIGSPTDALLVGGVLTGSAAISGAQQMRAEQALAELLSGQRLPARVVDADGADRIGDENAPFRIVPAAGLQPGHVIDLQSGDVVPADARLLTVQDLEIDEATLTGESTAIAKELAATPGAELPDRVCMVYEGTTVVAGTGHAVVVAVGAATEAGRALALAGRAGSPAGMQHRLEELTSKGLPVTLLGGAAVTVMGLLRRVPLRSAIGSGVSVAVAAVPEGLPLMATVAQLGAARRLSRRGVLVRASRTVEALGRVDTVCFDKTGTLTEGRLRLVRAAGLDGAWGPEAHEARRVLRAAALAGPSPNGDRPLSHATDQAVLDAAQAVLGEDLDEAWEELAEIPFHSERGFSAVVGRTPKKARLVVKGAPEVLLPRCTHVRDDEGKHPLDRAGQERAAAAVHALATDGLRVLAVARRNVDDLLPEVHAADDLAEIGDLTLLGFIGLADTPRPMASATVAALRTVCIDTVMITGDHPVTARTIAARLGIPTDRLVTGPELAALDEPTRIARVAEASVFARVSPEQKLQIIEGLQRNGRVVGMTGDGANDAAAIRLADVGIGMAAKGSTSARTAADLVLTEPDVSLILDALVEGRAMWRRVRDAVAVLLGGNVGEVAFTLLGTGLGGRAPISTRQFLVVNMFTDLLPSMALALAPTPADPGERAALLAAGPPSLGAPLLRDIGFRGAVTAFGALAAWQLGRLSGTRRRASTIALASLVGAELGQTLLLSGRDPLVLATGIGSAAVLAAIIQVPGISQFFGCTPLGPVAWAIVLGSSAAATLASGALPHLLPRLGVTGSGPSPGDG